MMTGSQDPAAGDDRLRADYADREQVTDIVQQGDLTRDDPGTRARRAVAAARRQPLARAAAASSGCVVVAVAALRFFASAESGGPDPGPYHAWALPALIVALGAVVAALFILGYGVGASVEQRRSRRRLSLSAGPGGHAPDGGRRGVEYGP